MGVTETAYVTLSGTTPTLHKVAGATDLGTITRSAAGTYAITATGITPSNCSVMTTANAAQSATTIYTATAATSATAITVYVASRVSGTYSLVDEPFSLIVSC